MPLYNVACRTPLSTETRQAAATAITKAHCESTGAPAQFVNVVFLDHYPLQAGHAVSVLGGVRTGGTRTQAVIDRLEQALRDGIAAAIGEPAENVGLSLVGVASNWVMEGGDVMPDPGDEAAWLAEHQG